MSASFDTETFAHLNFGGKTLPTRKYEFMTADEELDRWLTAKSAANGRHYQRAKAVFSPIAEVLTPAVIPMLLELESCRGRRGFGRWISDWFNGYGQVFIGIFPSERDPAMVWRLTGSSCAVHMIAHLETNGRLEYFTVSVNNPGLHPFNRDHLILLLEDVLGKKWRIEHVGTSGTFYLYERTSSQILKRVA